MPRKAVPVPHIPMSVKDFEALRDNATVENGNKLFHLLDHLVKLFADEYGPDFPVDAEHKTRINIQQVRCDFPSINIVILEYSARADDREVLFGWGHHAHDQRGFAFSSTSPDLVDTFDRLFDSISGTCQDVDQQIGKLRSVSAISR